MLFIKSNIQTVRNTNIFRTFIILSLVALLWSCKKEPDLLGLDLVPESDLLNHDFIDTITIQAYTVREDSVRTDELTTNLLGSIADPIFGTTTASIYTQFRLPSTHIDFGTNPVVDSLILTLPYKGIYGDSMAVQNIKVYELSDTLSKDTSYYQFNTVNVNNEVIGQATFIPNTWKFDSVNGVKIYPHMRIALTQAFANKILSADSLTLSANDKFLRVFKGLYLTSEKATSPGTGSIMYLDLNNSQSLISMYYHNSTDTTKLQFVMNSYCARFNNYNHYDYQGADPMLLEQFAGNHTSGNEKLFLQAMGGAKIRLEFPYLNNLANKNIAIHEAALILENGDQTNEFYPMPTSLSIRWLDSLGHYGFLPDANEVAAYQGGTSIDDKSYRIRITRYIQQRILHPDIPHYGLMLIANGSSLISNRALINGNKAQSGRLRLLVYYTLLK